MRWVVGEQQQQQQQRVGAVIRRMYSYWLYIMHIGYLSLYSKVFQALEVALHGAPLGRALIVAVPRGWRQAGQ